MRTDRRSFLQRLVAGAAAVAGFGALAPGVARAEASEATLMHPDDVERLFGKASRDAYVRKWDAQGWTFGAGGLTVTGNATLGGAGRVVNLRPGTYLAPTMPIPSNTTIRGAGVDQTTIVQAPTFEALQADCAARGCWLVRHLNHPFGTVYRHSGWMGPGYQTDLPEATHLPAIEAWLTSLHAEAPTWRPSYGGVLLTREGQQIVARTGDEVIAALQDETVVSDGSVLLPALRST